MLEQDARDAVDLIILARDGAKPEHECRIAPNGQVNTIIGQMRRVHPQLQGVQLYTLIDFQFTLPADPNFCVMDLFFGKKNLHIGLKRVSISPMSLRYPVPHT